MWYQINNILIVVENNNYNVEGKIVLKFNVQIHKTLAKKYREKLNDLASSNQIVKTAAT